MSAHNVLYDLLKAPYETVSPVDGKTISIDRQFEVFPLDTNSGAQAITLSAPTKGGMVVFFFMMRHTGDATLTVTGTYDGTNSAITFTAAGQWLALVSGPVSLGSSLNASGSEETYRWNVLRSSGASGALQPSGASQAAVAQTQTALTDNSGGSASTTLAAISDTATKNAVASIAAELALIKTDVAATITLANALRTALVATGSIKGSA